MQFQVPQFIDREAKIVGPFTLRQSLILGVAIGVGFVFYSLHNFLLLVIWIVVGGSLSFSLAFSKSGGRSFSAVIVDFFRFSFSPKKYLWKEKSSLTTISMGEKRAPLKTEEPKSAPTVELIRQSKLKNLTTEVQTRK